MKTKSVQDEILRMLLEEHETPKRIALRRGTSRQSVYKIIKKLEKNLGIKLLSRSYIGGLNRGGCTRKNTPLNMGVSPNMEKPILKGDRYRLHGQEWEIKVISRSDRFLSLLKGRVSRTKVFRGIAVTLYKNTVMVFGGPSFFGPDPGRCLAESMSFWNHFFISLETDLGAILVKPRSMNISLVKCHVSDCDNEIARDWLLSGNHFQVRADDDGRVWCLLDNSFNLLELETVHPDTSIRDMEAVISPFLNDLRGYASREEPIPLISDLAEGSRYLAREIGSLKDQFRAVMPPTLDPGVPDYIG